MSNELFDGRSFVRREMSEGCRFELAIGGWCQMRSDFETCFDLRHICKSRLRRITTNTDPTVRESLAAI